jgi:hypothetical protein
MSETGASGGAAVAESGAGRWTRTERTCFVLFVAGLLAGLVLLVHPWYDRTNDGSTYLITARALAAGEGYTYLGELFRIRPPGFSALLSLCVGGEGGTSFALLNGLVSLFGIAGVVLLYLHQRTHLGWVLALLTSVAVWLNPGYQRLCNQIMSDVPGLALLLACLLVERWASRHPSWWREIVLGVAIGAGAYVRSITILLVPAILVARILARLLRGEGEGNWPSFVLRRLAVVAVAAWLVLVPWSVAKQRAAPPPPADQTLNYSISTAMWHEDPGDPGSPRLGVGEILKRMPPRLRDVSLVVGSRMQHRIPGSPPPGRAMVFGHAVLTLLMAACLLAVLVRRRAPAEWLAVGVLLVVAVYFIFTDRLALPVFVFALAATVEVLRDLARRFGGARAGIYVPAAALLLLIAVDFAPRHDWEAIRGRHREFTSLASAVEEVVEPDARLAAGQGFHYDVYLERPVYNLMHAVRRAGRFDAAEAIIDKYDIDSVVLSPHVPQDRVLMPYFAGRYGPGTPAGAALVWRVRPRPALPSSEVAAGEGTR